MSSCAARRCEQLIRLRRSTERNSTTKRSDFSEAGNPSYRLQPIVVRECCWSWDRSRKSFSIEFVGSASKECCSSWGWEEFPVSHTEAQITASNDGENFFRAHCDDAQEMIASRRLTASYIFSSRTKPVLREGSCDFTAQRRPAHIPFSIGSYQAVCAAAESNCVLPHVPHCTKSPSTVPVTAFADGRFTVNGWLHQYQ